MYLNAEQRLRYAEDGYVVLRDYFSPSEVDNLCHAFSDSAADDGPYRVHADENGSVDTVYAPHLRDTVFNGLVQSARLLKPVQEIIGEHVYPYQVKINIKEPFGNNKVDWHQDYAAWRSIDQLRSPRLVNAAIFLDAATEFNGALSFIPGSHRYGLLSEIGQQSAAGHFDPKDIALKPEDLAPIVESRGMDCVHAAAGSLLLFHPLVVHGSPPNMAIKPRRLFLVTYNSSSNLPQTDSPRPDYLVGRMETKNIPTSQSNRAQF